MPKEPGEPKEEGKIEDLSPDELGKRIEKLVADINNSAEQEDDNMSMSVELSEGDRQRQAQLNELQEGRVAEQQKYLAEYKKRTGKDYIFAKPEAENK